MYFHIFLGEHDQSQCYVCLNSIKGRNRYNKGRMVYVGTAYAELPKPHTEYIPIPKPVSPDVTTVVSTNYASSIGNDPTYEPSEFNNRMIPISQNWLDEVLKHVNMSKRDSEYVARKLNQNNLLEPGVRITAYRNRQEVFQQYFSVNEDNTFVYCNDIEKLMSEMGMKYDPHKWRLFIDSSKTSMKAVLLYYNNKKTSIPIAYNLNTKETYESVKYLLESVNYENHKWRICCDLKMVALLCGLQGGFTKNMCFICLWNTRYKGNQYQKHDWEKRDVFRVGTANVIHEPLVPTDKVLLPPLHIKLGIFKNFVKVFSVDGPAFTTLRSTFPRLSASKVKEGIVYK